MMCGIVGIVSNGDAVISDLIFSLRVLQHRGKDSAGVVTSHQGELRGRKGMGTVEVVFGANGVYEYIGCGGIGHVRYSTAGGTTLAHAHPFEGEFCGKRFALAHNGNLVQMDQLFAYCKSMNFPELSEIHDVKEVTDTQLIALLIANSHKATFDEALEDALSHVVGTYSIVAIYDDTVYGIRDPSGNRPLAIGEGRGICALVSESAVCDSLGIRFVREVQPGEMIIMQSSEYPEKCMYAGRALFQNIVMPQDDTASCSFEPIYFLRPDSIFNGKRAQLVREKLGRELFDQVWEEHENVFQLVESVVPVPDSGLAAAIGFSQASEIPLVQALIRYHYSGRTFISLEDKREKGLQIKFGIIPELVRGRIICVVDDSLVRATTMRKLVAMLKDAGARSVIACIAAPLYIEPCHYGIDTYRVSGELAAKRHRADIDGICKEIGADGLYYLSVNRLKEVLGDGMKGKDYYCYACFTGKYPIPLTTEKPHKYPIPLIAEKP